MIGSRVYAVILLAALGAGCATSTITKRRNERSSAYAELAPEVRTKVDAGNISVGMSTDAVYIAWGKPAQVFTGQSENGKATKTWTYTATAWQEQRVWRHRYLGTHNYHSYGGPNLHLDYDYEPRSFPSAHVVFEDGVVKSWNTLAQPQR